MAGKATSARILTRIPASTAALAASRLVCDLISFPPLTLRTTWSNHHCTRGEGWILDLGLMISRLEFGDEAEHDAEVVVIGDRAVGPLLRFLRAVPINAHVEVEVFCPIRFDAHRKVVDVAARALLSEIERVVEFEVDGLGPFLLERRRGGE